MPRARWLRGRSWSYTHIMSQMDSPSVDLVRYDLMICGSGWRTSTTWHAMGKECCLPLLSRRWLPPWQARTLLNGQEKA